MQTFLILIDRLRSVNLKVEYLVLVEGVAEVLCMVSFADRLTPKERWAVIPTCEHFR